MAIREASRERRRLLIILGGVTNKAAAVGVLGPGNAIVVIIPAEYIRKISGVSSVTGETHNHIFLRCSIYRAAHDVGYCACPSDRCYDTIAFIAVIKDIIASVWQSNISGMPDKRVGAGADAAGGS